MIVCNATDPDSRFAKKCSASNRGKRQVSDHEMDAAYSLVQGPLLFVNEKKEEKQRNGGASNEKNGKYANFKIKRSQTNMLYCTWN